MHTVQPLFVFPNNSLPICDLVVMEFLYWLNVISDKSLSGIYDKASFDPTNFYCIMELYKKLTERKKSSKHTPQVQYHHRIRF